MPTYKANVTDRQQDVLEEATFEGGVPVFEDAKSRDIAKGAQTGAQKTMNAGTNIGRNNGVIMPWDDKPGKDMTGIIGRRV